MRAFEVFLNGERLCPAGIAGDCILNVIITHLKRNRERDEIQLSVGGLVGLVSAVGKHIYWANTQLSEGDEIRVRIIESDSADEPKERVARDSEEDLEQRKALVRATAKKLGWTINEPTNTPSALGEPKTSE